MNDRKKGSISVVIAIIIYAITMITDRFFIQINDILYVLLMSVSIIFIISGIVLEKRYKKHLDIEKSRGNKKGREK